MYNKILVMRSSQFQLVERNNMGHACKRNFNYFFSPTTICTLLEEKIPKDQIINSPVTVQYHTERRN